MPCLPSINPPIKDEMRCTRPIVGAMGPHINVSRSLQTPRDLQFWKLRTNGFAKRMPQDNMMGPLGIGPFFVNSKYEKHITEQIKWLLRCLATPPDDPIMLCLVQPQEIELTSTTALVTCSTTYSSPLTKFFPNNLLSKTLWTLLQNLAKPNPQGVPGSNAH